MAGIYIHIPFCRQACYYCDFHFSTNRQLTNAMVSAINREMEWQKDFLDGEKIATIYLGGGTPSLLNEKELASIFDSLHRNFNIAAAAEITVEANPDDLTHDKLAALRNIPVNRLSIGIQSFIDEELISMNRIHSAAGAIRSVQDAQAAGFANISVDLIYGLPGSGLQSWNQNLKKALALQVQHLSCYCLTIEPKTALARFITTGKVKPVEEELAAQQFEHLMSEMQEAGWKHYEISNFSCDLRHVSKHNTAYWQGEKYLGLGPSAHSFNGHLRQWNIANNHHYLKAMEEGKMAVETEMLTETQRVNERIMTQLRTLWGLNVTAFEAPVARGIVERSRKFIDDGFCILENDSLRLTQKGMLIADRIVLELMPDEA